MEEQNKITNIPYIKDEEIKAYAVLCGILEHKDDKNDDIFKEYNISHERLEQLQPLVNMIKRLSTMIDIMAPKLTAPIMDTEGVIKYYVAEAEKIMQHEEDVCTPEYWRMRLDYEQRHKND